MNRTTEQQQLSHGVYESSETEKDSFMFVPQCEDSTLLQIGEILNGTYQITRLIAQGGMGIVYEGIDLFLHRKVAIKVLVTDIDSEDYEKELKLFQTEINLCGNLLHPNIVQIYYAGTYHSLPYLVMEYIDGVSINEYMSKQRCCSWKKVAILIRNIAKGLAYIHKNNILHRDIKPSNILVTANGMPILIDFGISIKKNLVGIETNDGELSGTIRYMSPEQVAGQSDQIDERSDIYSLGLILYEILTKRPAYTGSPNEVIGQIFNSSLLPPSEVNINIPESLSNITMKAIAKNVEERYSTAEEFIEDLELYIKNVNNKPIINEVPLWQKAYYKLKPPKKIAIALKCIAFIFIILASIPPFSVSTKNGSKRIHIIKTILNPSSIPEIATILIASVIDPIYEIESIKPKPIDKSQEDSVQQNHTIDYMTNSDADIPTGSQNTYKEEKQFSHKEQVSLQPKLEEQIKLEQKESPEKIKETVIHNPTVIVESTTNTNDSHSHNNNDNNDNNNPAPKLTFEEILLKSGKFYLTPGKYRVWVDKKTGYEFIIKEKDGRNIVIFRNSCDNGKPLDNYKEICENIYNITSFNKISELKEFQVKSYPFYSVEKLNKNENGEFKSENISNNIGLYNAQCPFGCKSYFPPYIKDLFNSNNCEGYMSAYSQLLERLEDIKKIYSVNDYFTLLGFLGSIYGSFAYNNDILKDNPTYSNLNNILENFFPMIDDIDDNSIYTKLNNMLENLNEFYPNDSDSSSPYEDLKTILLGYILENLNKFYSASKEGRSSPYEDLKTILENLKKEIGRLMNENHEELEELFTALLLLYGISDCDTWIPDTSLPDTSPCEKLLDTLKKLPSFFSPGGGYTNLKEVLNDSTKFNLLNYTLTTTITPQENPISTTEIEQPKEIKFTVGFRPIFVFHK